MNIKLTFLITMALATTTAFAQKRKAPIKKKAVQANTMSPKVKALYDNMLQNTQIVFVIDSTVVDADKVMDVITLPKAYGKYVAYNKFFDTNSALNENSVVYVNGFDNRCYYNEVGTDSISRLFMRERQGEGWDEARPLTEINELVSNATYPYMASDGQTLYFAGKSDEEGLGERDIYMTKYDAEEGKFLKPENIGLPFNSTKDDFIYVEADADGIAWFASTRRQPEGKVCVYTFVPSETRQNYDADDLDDTELKNYAELMRIRSTWPTPEIRQTAMQRLQRLQAKTERQNSEANEICFIVNDEMTYTRLNDFKSAETKSAYADLKMKQNEANKLVKEIDSMRTRYHNANDKAALGRSIALSEQKLEQKQKEIKKAASELRKAENNLLKRH
uniref:hypothetical protein n=1 Tax=Prevotella sp. TaxID=59823 RepID=UPI003FF082FC